MSSLGKFKGTLAKVLNIKVIRERIEGGRVGIFEKIGGKKKFQRRILEIMKERDADFSHKPIGITHTRNLEDVESIKQEIIEQLQPKEILANYWELQWVPMPVNMVLFFLLKGPKSGSDFLLGFELFVFYFYLNIRIATSVQAENSFKHRLI